MGTSELSSKAGTRRALALGPLLASIGREIAERSDALARLLVRREREALAPAARAVLDAECATHRRELRLAHVELSRLGCQVVGSHPLVFRVDAGADGEDSVRFWCCS